MKYTHTATVAKIRKQPLIESNKQKQVDAQIDEAVKLYNNLKLLINNKSGGVLKCFDRSQKKLSTLDNFYQQDRIKPKALFFDSTDARVGTNHDYPKNTQESVIS